MNLSEEHWIRKKNWMISQRISTSHPIYNVKKKLMERNLFYYLFSNMGTNEPKSN